MDRWLDGCRLKQKMTSGNKHINIEHVFVLSPGSSNPEDQREFKIYQTIGIG
jgi:hypothetical protein